MAKKHTAGELSNKAARDTSKTDPLDVAYAMMDDTTKELRKCIEAHNPIFDMDEYFLVIILAYDPLLKNLVRKKFYAYPFMPRPRPDQSVFLYNKRKDEIVKRLWVLPNANMMERLYKTITVPKEYLTMKAWSHAFFDGCFWEFIRKQHGIKLYSEEEELERNREKLLKSGAKYVDSSFSAPFDFTKLQTEEVINAC